MLVRIDKIVIRGVVEEDEAETDWEAAKRRTNPVETGIGGPGEDEETNGDEPARTHHGNKSDFSRGLAAIISAHFHVMFIDERSAGSRAKDTDSKRDEHQSRAASRVSFSFLVDDGEGDEEHVEEAVENGHVSGDEEDD